MDIDLLANLMEYMPDAIYFKDRSSRFLAISRALAELYGLDDPSHAIGKTDFDFFPEEQAAEMMADERRIILTGEPVVGKEECEAMVDGRERWFSTTKLPLRDRQGEIVGILGISREITARKAAEDALREAHAQLEDDLSMAREMQEAFLPERYPAFPPGVDPACSHLRFQHLYMPSGEVGGDFFAVRALSDTQAAIFICDVMGHGVRSALVTSMIHALVTEQSLDMSDPGELLNYVNQRLFSNLGRASSVVFTSALACVLDATNGTLRYANAGHPSPIVLRHGSETASPLEASKQGMGPALALCHDADYPVCTHQLGPRDRLLLFTDGLFEVESDSGELYGETRLVEAVDRAAAHPADDLLPRLVDEVRGFASHGRFGDDVCILCIERSSAADGPTPA